MTEEEKQIRREAVARMFEVLGVDASVDRMRGWLNATALIPCTLFLAALQKLVREKDDGYQTAPQPGECWKAARSLIPRSKWEHSPTQGSLPPRWFRQIEREEGRRALSRGPEILSLPAKAARASS